ncbi:hypothetical protein D3C71_1039450 [compost metagenome]
MEQRALKTQRFVIQLEIVPHHVVFALTGTALQILKLPVLDGTNTGKGQEQHAEHHKQETLTGRHGTHDEVYSTFIELICQIARP